MQNPFLACGHGKQVVDQIRPRGCCLPSLALNLCQSSHYGVQISKELEQALYSLYKPRRIKSFQMTYIPLCLPTLLSLFLSASQTHLSGNQRSHVPPCSWQGRHTCSLISWSFRLCSLISWRSCSALSSSWDTSIRACSKLRFKLCRKQKF